MRPDGKITTPLVQDAVAQGKTPTELAADLRGMLSRYVQEPTVTVLVKTFAAPTNAAAIRVIGAAAMPKIVPYRSGLTALDVMIEVGGLNTFASGNRAVLIRKENGTYREYPLRLADFCSTAARWRPIARSCRATSCEFRSAGSDRAPPPHRASAPQGREPVCGPAPEKANDGE